MMNMVMEYRTPTVAEYQKLRNAAGWEPLPDEMVETGLNTTLFSSCVLNEGKLIGTGRVIGDGAMYFYVQDVIVLPQFQGKGVGMRIMNAIETYLNKNARKNAFIGLMAAEDVSGFYRKFNYMLRPDSRPGMYKTMK